MEELKVNKLKEIRKAKTEKIEKEKVKKKTKYTGLYFVLPSLIGVAVFTLLPFLDVILRSFQSAISRDFIGVNNYIDIFNSLYK